MTRMAAVAALTIAFVATACTGSPQQAATSTTPTKTPSPVPAIAAITYKVTGGAPTVRIHYGVTGSTVAVTTKLPWQATGQAPVGANVEMSAFGLGKQGFRLACVLTITTPGRSPYPSYDSSHAIGTGGSLNNPIVLYDDQCNTAAAVPAVSTPSG
jgi:hypothetical protein